MTRELQTARGGSVTVQTEEMRALVEDNKNWERKIFDFSLHSNVFSNPYKHICNYGCC